MKTSSRRFTRPRGSVSATLVMIVLLVAWEGTAGPAGASVGDPVGIWVSQPLSSTGNAALPTLAATSSTDVWALGRRDAGQNYIPWAEHFDGAGWTPQAVPAEGGAAITSYLGSGLALATDDVWAAGSASDGNTNWGIIRHWDGMGWSASSLPAQGDWSITTGFGASSSSDVWLAGIRIKNNGGPSTGYIDHWDGLAWASTPMPSVCGGSFSFYSVAAVATDDAWAVGECGDQPMPLVMHWDGGDWSRVTAPMPDGFSSGFLDDVAAVSADDVWAVGIHSASTGGNTPLIEHWDGSDWSPVEGGPVGPANDAVLHDIAVIATGDVWAAGNANGQPVTEHWDGKTWSVIPGVSLYQEQNLESIIALPGGTLWSAGSDRGATGQLFQQLTEAPVVDGAGLEVSSIKASMGRPVAWRFPRANRTSHSVTDATGLKLFDSGQRSRGRSFVYAYRSAGTYVVKDSSTGDRESIGVPVRASAAGMKVTVRVASAGARRGFVYDVQMRKPGAAHFVSLTSGMTSAKVTKTLSLHGTFLFRARLREPGLAASSAWSPADSVTV